jgi:predicted ribosome-associated RNA-binding protein Tma20
MKRHFISKRETKEFQSIMEKFGISLKSKTIEIEENDQTVIYDEGKPILVKIADTWLPTLAVMLANSFPSVRIDDGAYDRIKKGANLYAAGIKEIRGTLIKNSTCIVEDSSGRPVGAALVVSEVEDVVGRKGGAHLRVYELH